MANDDRNRAMAMALLQSGLGIAANSQVPYGGSVIPGVAQGLALGLVAYNDTLDRIRKEKRLAAKEEDELLKRQSIDLITNDPSMTAQQKAAFAIAPEAAVRSMFPRTGAERLYDVMGPTGPVKLPASKASGMAPFIAPRGAGQLSGLGKLRREMEGLQPGDPALEDYRKKILLETTRAPPMRVSVESFQAPVPVINPETGEAELVQFGSRGGEPRLTGFKPRALAEKPLTAGQARSELLAPSATRALSEFKILIQGNPDTPGYDPTSIPGRVDKFFAGGDLNFLASDRGQQYTALGRELVANLGYGKSGANLTADEWETGRQTYLPQPGDKAGVVAQKIRALDSGVEGLRAGLKRQNTSNSDDADYQRLLELRKKYGR